MPMLYQLSYPPTLTIWAHLDSNQGPAGYEPAALTPELWAQVPSKPEREP